jgi:hypothetical protein
VFGAGQKREGEGRHSREGHQLQKKAEGDRFENLFALLSPFPSMAVQVDRTLHASRRKQLHATISSTLNLPIPIPPLMEIITGYAEFQGMCSVLIGLPRLDRFC